MRFGRSRTRKFDSRVPLCLSRIEQRGYDSNRDRSLANVEENDRIEEADLAPLQGDHSIREQYGATVLEFVFPSFASNPHEHLLNVAKVHVNGDVVSAVSKRHTAGKYGESGLIWSGPLCNPTSCGRHRRCRGIHFLLAASSRSAKVVLRTQAGWLAGSLSVSQNVFLLHGRFTREEPSGRQMFPAVSPSVHLGSFCYCLFGWRQKCRKKAASVGTKAALSLETLSRGYHTVSGRSLIASGEWRVETSTICSSSVWKSLTILVKRPPGF